MDETRRLARFLSGLRYEDLPPQVVDTAKLCVLDIVGVGVGATRWQWPRILAEVVAETGATPKSSVWGLPLRTSTAGAALVNGVSAHGIEMDDRAPRASTHPGAYAVPAALSVTEARHASGRELICAVVTGYELGLRIGLAMRMRRGVHKSGHKGVWLGTGAAGRALALDELQMTHALGIAGSMASGLFEFSRDPVGTMVKRLHGGLGAHNGVVAAQLAAKGLTGPATVLEGEYGYVRTYGREDFAPRWEELTRDLGLAFRILEREVKPYAAWGGSHLAIDAVAQIFASGRFPPSDIARVEVGGSRRLLENHESSDPESEMAAQYSLPFLTALSLVHGPESLVDPISIWTAETLRDQTVRALAHSVLLRVDDDLELLSLEKNHYGGARVTVTLRDGAQREAVVHNSKGTLENPVTYAELEQKFRRMSGAVLPARQVDEVVELIRSLEELDDVATLGDALRTDGVAVR